MIRVANLAKRFPGGVEAVRGVSFEVPRGAFLVLVGPSGCGKSTMLRVLAGLEAPSAGTVEFDGRTVSDGDGGLVVDAAKRDAGLVFQSYALWPHMTVAGNVDWPLKVAGWPAAARRGRVEEVLGLLAITELARRYPNEISGGQQQRVAIARTVAPRPGVLLFDEPLSNLDARLRVEMRTELMRVHRATGATSVYVTHDQLEAVTMASHVAVMNRGRIEQFGAPDELLREPASAFVASFLGTPPANLVPFAPAGDGAVTLAGRVVPAPAGLPRPPGPGGGLAMYRAEDIAVSGEAGPRSLPLELAEASPIAGRVMVTGVAPGGLRLTAVVDRAPPARPGETVHFHLPERPAALFGEAGERLA